MVHGIILFWHGTIASIPEGYVLCDGNNGTPDLRDKFVVGAKEDDGGVAKTNLTGALTASGGNKDHTHTGTTDGHRHAATDELDPVYEPDAVSGADYDYATDTFTTENQNVIPVPYYALAYIMKT